MRKSIILRIASNFVAGPVHDGVSLSTEPRRAQAVPTRAPNYRPAPPMRQQVALEYAEEEVEVERLEGTASATDAATHTTTTELAEGKESAEQVVDSPRQPGSLFAAEPASRQDIPQHPAEKEIPRPVLVHKPIVDDPVLDFIKQGRELLDGIEDGGAARMVSETGVPGVWCLNLENIGEGNAITGEMMKQLEEAMRMVNRSIKTNSELLALVIRGSGLNFSFGTSKSIHQEMFEGDEGLILSRYMSSILLELSQLPIITIAAMEGVTAGSASEVALSCDFRIASEDAMLQFADTINGVTPGWGGAQRLANITSPRTALLLTASSKPVTSAEAMDLGIVDCICKPGDSYNEAISFIEGNLHDHSGLGGTHGEITWRRHGIRRMKENVAVSEMFTDQLLLADIESRNLKKIWTNAKIMTERRSYAAGLQKAALKSALEDWSTLTDPHAMSLPLHEDIGKGLEPVLWGSTWGRIGWDVDHAFTALFERKPNQPLLNSPQSTSFVKHKYRHASQPLLDGADLEEERTLLRDANEKYKQVTQNVKQLPPTTPDV